jgi:hypothetical protein
MSANVVATATQNVMLAALFATFLQRDVDIGP